MSSIITIENISKQYRLGAIGSGTLSQDLARWWKTLRGQEDPFLKIGETNDRASKAKGNLVWALKDINFEVQQGDVLGIIGKNGAGKSTLLKILSRVTAPTTGQIKVKGRIASLLEVGTGFHPELSGRENIFLNGAILGMTKKEITGKFDEIVEFSGVERYIDTPVKHYSSGMYVRLAFAVAAHLEPEILIVDEVLAVGDAEFQKKCLGKIKDVSGQGRTVLFVSHNMASMKSLCNKGVLLHQGKVGLIGTMNEVVERYLESANKVSQNGEIQLNASSLSNGQLTFQKIVLIDERNNKTDNVPYLSKLIFILEFENKVKLTNTFLDIRISTMDGIEVLHASNVYGNFEAIESGKHKLKVIMENNLQPGRYTVTLGAHALNGTTIEFVEHILDFNVSAVSLNAEQGYIFSYQMCLVRADSKWEEIV